MIIAVILLSIVCAALIFVILDQLKKLKKRDKVILYLGSVLEEPSPFDRILDPPYRLDYNESLQAVSIFFYPNCPRHSMHVALHHIAFKYPNVKNIRFENFPSDAFLPGTFLGLHYDILDFSRVSFDDCQNYGIPLISKQVPCQSIIMPSDTPYVDFSKFDNSLEELVLPGPYAPAINVPSYHIPIPNVFCINVPEDQLEYYTESTEWSKLYFCHSPKSERVKITIRSLG